MQRYKNNLSSVKYQTNHTQNDYKKLYCIKISIDNSTYHFAYYIIHLPFLAVSLLFCYDLNIMLSNKFTFIIFCLIPRLPLVLIVTYNMLNYI